MLSFMFSNKEDFKYSIKGLVQCATNGDKSVRSILDELKTHGYLIVTPRKGADGKIECWDYDFFETPDKAKAFLNPDAEKAHVEKADVEKESQSNNDIKEDINKEKSIIDNTKKKPKEFDLTFIAVEFTSLMTEWLEYKVELGEPYKTTAGIKKTYNNLIKFSNNNAEVAQAIVDYAIAKEWHGIWPINLRELSRWKESQGDCNDKLRDIFRMMDEDMKLRQM
jgi:hypothetical protein